MKATAVLTLVVIATIVFVKAMMPYAKDEIKFECVTKQGTTDIEMLKREAPETLVAPRREQFVNSKAFDCAQTKFEKYGRWDTD